MKSKNNFGFYFFSDFPALMVTLVIGYGLASLLTLTEQEVLDIKLQSIFRE